MEKRKKNNERGTIEEPVYGFWVDQNRGVVDLWYWAFYPFNFGKSASRFGILGNHVADWEHLRVRTVDGVPVSVDFSTHEGGRLSAGTVRWEDVEKVDDRPVAYVAMGSHGVWPEPGDHVYADASPSSFAVRIHTKHERLTSVGKHLQGCRQNRRRGSHLGCFRQRHPRTLLG